MAHNVYECMFIFDSNKYARDPSGVSGTVQEMVDKVQGEILANRLWTEQKLAYPIRRQRKGTYWLTYFRMDSNKLSEFNRLCQLNEFVLRNLVLKIDPRLVDAMVSHALGEVKKDAPSEAQTKEESVPAGATEASDKSV